jgi:hypothetical protein
MSHSRLLQRALMRDGRLFKARCAAGSNLPRLPGDTAR